jgi:phage terminase small subunit
MARPSLPKHLHILKGTGVKNPARMKARENEPENTDELGKPSKYLNAKEKLFFKEIAELAIEGVLGQADRIAVEQAACLLAKCRGLHIADGSVIPATSAEQNQLYKYLSQFGMTPADRSKINILPPKSKEPSPWDDF